MPLERSALPLLASLALLACAHRAGSADPGRPAPPAHVELRFAWPAALRAHVTIYRESQRLGQPPRHALVHQTLAAERRGAELWVFTRDVSAEGDEPGLAANAGVGEALVGVVTPAGAFLRAEGVDRALDLVAAVDAPGRAAARAALVRSAAEEWEALAGAWSGRTLEEGRPLRKRFHGSVPLLETVEAGLAVEYGLEGWVPCTAEETERRCVQLFYRGEAAPEDRGATLSRIQEVALGHGPDRPVAEAFDARFDITVVTEPDTLVPRRLTARDRLRLRLRLPDGRVQEVEDRADDAYLFVPLPGSDL